MGTFSHWRTSAIAFATVALATVFAGCNSGGSSPSPAPTLAPGKGSAQCLLGASPASTTVPLVNGTNVLTTPTVGGCSITITLTGVTANTTATLATQLTAPSGLPSPVATQIPGGPPAPPPGFTLPFTSVFYATITFNGAATFSAGNPLIVVTVPSVTAGNNLFGASWQGAPGVTTQFTGYTSNCTTGANIPLTVSGNTLSAPACSGGGSPSQIPAGAQFTLSLVYF